MIRHKTFTHADNTICWLNDERIWITSTNGNPCKVCNVWQRHWAKGLIPMPAELSWREELLIAWSEIRAECYLWWQGHPRTGWGWRLRWVFPSWWMRKKDG